MKIIKAYAIGGDLRNKDIKFIQKLTEKNIDLESQNKELLKCLIEEMRAMERQMGINNVKKTRACFIIELVTNKKIDEVLIKGLCHWREL